MPSSSGNQPDPQSPDDGEHTARSADAESRAEAMRFIRRRLTIWTIPLALTGLLLVGLGIPWWISVLAMLAVLAVVVFEVDF